MRLGGCSSVLLLYARFKRKKTKGRMRLRYMGACLRADTREQGSVSAVAPRQDGGQRR